MKPFAITILLLTSLTSVFGFPIDPVGLRELIQRSDLIVLAQVEPPPARPRQADPGLVEFRFSLHGESPARLKPASVLKGVAPDGLVEVHFNPNMVCPSPPRFQAGSNVLAFLRRTRNTNGYETVALSYGAVEVSGQEAVEYAARISDWLALDRRYGGRVPTNAVVEWLVRCVETPATKADGAQDLVDRRPLLGTNVAISPYAKHLTPAQWGRLSNVVFRAEFITGGDLALLDRFKTRAKSRVVQHLVAYLRKASQPVPPVDVPYRGSDGFPEPWNVFDASWMLADLLNDPTATALVRAHNRTDFFEANKRVEYLRGFLPAVDVALRGGRNRGAAP